MTWDEFTAALPVSLNEQQLEAVRALEGPVLLLAVPGSGKTTVLVARLGYMILCAQIAPEKILTLTYTVAAARDMAARFEAFFGKEAGNRLEFRTINGVCAKIIHYYGQMLGKSPFSLIKDDKTVISMLSGIYYQEEEAYATEGDLKSIRTMITYIKNSMLTEAQIGQLEKQSDYRIQAIYRAYCRELRDRGLMDYDDQMTYAYAILRSSPETLAYFRQQYTYLCVDEAQDTSKIQHAVIRLLAGEGDNLFMVGDEDQSIYGFRAACPEALLSFEEDHPGARVLFMETNFRSQGKIIQAADGFIQQNTLRRKKHMRAVRGEGEDIREIALKARSAQYPYLVKVAENCRVQTAVLYRDNESALPLIDRLERMGIPYQLRSAEFVFFSHRVVQDIQNIMRFAIDPKDDQLFLQIYYKLPTFLSKQTAVRVCGLGKRKNMEILEAAISHGNLEAPALRSIRLLRAQLKELLKERGDRAVTMIVQNMGYKDYLRRAGLSDGKLFILRAIGVNEPSPQRFLDRLSRLQEIISQKNFIPGCQFYLSTIHASKGLEYDIVYLMDVADGLFPEKLPGKNRPLKRQELEAYEEERRLFYVGATRAKNSLCLFTMDRNTLFVSQLLSKASCEGKGQKSLGGVGCQGKKRQSGEGDYGAFRAALSQGAQVTHKKFGQGTVEQAAEGRTLILFADGVRREFDLKVLYEHGLLKL